MTNPTPSQSARDAAAAYAEHRRLRSDTVNGYRKGRFDSGFLVQALHAAEQRGMERAAGIAENWGLTLPPPE